MNIIVVFLVLFVRQKGRKEERDIPLRFHAENWARECSPLKPERELRYVACQLTLHLHNNALSSIGYTIFGPPTLYYFFLNYSLWFMVVISRVKVAVPFMSLNDRLFQYHVTRVVAVVVYLSQSLISILIRKFVFSKLKVIYIVVVVVVVCRSTRIGLIITWKKWNRNDASSICPTMSRTAASWPTSSRPSVSVYFTSR